MIGYMITLGFLVIVLTILCCYLGTNRSKINKDIENKNYQLEEQNKELEKGSGSYEQVKKIFDKNMKKDYTILIPQMAPKSTKEKL